MPARATPLALSEALTRFFARGAPFEDGSLTAAPRCCYCASSMDQVRVEGHAQDCTWKRLYELWQRASVPKPFDATAVQRSGDFAAATAIIALTVILLALLLGSLYAQVCR